MNYLFTINRSAALLIITFLLSLNVIFSQTDKQKEHNPPDPTLHNEAKIDEYVPDLRDSQGRSPAYNYSRNTIVTTQVNVDAAGLNIVGDAANEPSIAVDRINPDRMVVGWRQFNIVTNNFRQAGFGFTANGGQNWTFPGVIQPGVFRSDPVLGSDVNGNFYYNSLTNSPDYHCHVFKSSNGGASWDGGTFAQGGDKQWMTIDKTGSPGTGNIYAYWTSSFSTCSPGFFTRSTDSGSSFENCVTIPNDPFWGTLAVGSNGDLYIGGSIGSDFLFARSTNAKNSGQVVAWDMTTIVNLDGEVSFGGGPNPGGLLGQTLISVDTSGGLYDGNIYLLCSVNRNSNPDPLDVMFTRSTNGGVSWSSPIKINNDPGTSAYQWFGTMSVAPNGRIDVIWLDTRDNPGTFLSALYYSNSKDGGVTWSANERLSSFFNPHLGWPNQNKMGDYFDMISDYTGAHLAWAGTFNGEQDVYYSHIIDTTVVPVELISFTASVAANDVTLNWSTATEINNYGFEIERRDDKSPWRMIGFKEGNGTTSEPKSYSYVDDLSLIHSSTLYFRLKQIDYDGSFTYSEEIEVAGFTPEEYSLEQNYPNPFNPVTNFGFKIATFGFVSLKVYDILGNEIVTVVNEELSPGEYDIVFDASDLPDGKAGLVSGIYYYQLRTESFVETKKMILLR